MQPLKEVFHKWPQGDKGYEHGRDTRCDSGKAVVGVCVEQKKHRKSRHPTKASTLNDRASLLSNPSNKAGLAQSCSQGH